MSVFISGNQLRKGAGILFGDVGGIAWSYDPDTRSISASAAPGISYDTIADGGSLTIGNGYTYEILRAPATLAAFALTMPDTPTDKQILNIASNYQINALTLNANTGQTLENAPTRLVPGISVVYVYDLANTTWIRVS